MSLGKTYLIAYNVSLVFGWALVLVNAIRHALSCAKGTCDAEIYATLSFHLQIFQTAAILEIVHALPFVGLVRSPVGTTAAQVFSRVMLVWGVIYVAPQVTENWVAYTMMTLAWAITEVIRYSFYACNLLGSVPHFLVWCRYTFFIVLYPIGVTGELLMVYGALPLVAQSGVLSITMPNAWNFAFSYYYYLIFFSLLYIPVFPKLYFYMFKQRRKVLNPAPKAGKQSTTSSRHQE